MSTWISIYVEESIQRTVLILRAKGMIVRYDPESYTNKIDPEYDNAFIERKVGLVSSCVRWRRDPNKANIAHIPERAMACVQLRVTHPEFEGIRACVMSSCTIQPHSGGPPQIWKGSDS